MPKKKKRAPIDRAVTKYVRNVSGDITPPANADEWKADLLSAFSAGWSSAVTHLTRLQRKRMKRRH